MEPQVAPLHALLEWPTLAELALIAFLMQHDSYHIGQVAFLRRQLGKPAMVYTRGVCLDKG